MVGLADGKGIVNVPATTPRDPTDIGVAKIVIPGAFEVKVVPAMIIPFERRVAACPATAITCAGVGDGRDSVDVPTIKP